MVLQRLCCGNSCRRGHCLHFVGLATDSQCGATSLALTVYAFLMQERQSDLSERWLLRGPNRYVRPYCMYPVHDLAAAGCAHHVTMMAHVTAIGIAQGHSAHVRTCMSVTMAAARTAVGAPVMAAGPTGLCRPDWPCWLCAHLEL